jgi:hypothetical protein
VQASQALRVRSLQALYEQEGTQMALSPTMLPPHKRIRGIGKAGRGEGQGLTPIVAIRRNFLHSGWNVPQGGRRAVSNPRVNGQFSEVGAGVGGAVCARRQAQSDTRYNSILAPAVGSSVDNA